MGSGVRDEGRWGVEELRVEEEIKLLFECLDDYADII
jgi:hypothetical protein